MITENDAYLDARVWSFDFNDFNVIHAFIVAIRKDSDKTFYELSAWDRTFAFPYRRTAADLFFNELEATVAADDFRKQRTHEQRLSIL